MKLHEYQAKDVFAKAGIRTPRGKTADTTSAAVAAAAEVGFPCVLKSQVLRGGRGKAGLIKLVRNEGEAAAESARLLAFDLGVRRLLVEEAVDIARELYLAFTLDPVASTGLLLASASGGVDIEELAAASPEKVLRRPFDLTREFLPYQARGVAYDLGLAGDEAKKAAAVVEALWKVFRGFDAELAEINPLFVTAAGDLVAGDGKLVIDDNALFRHPEYEPGRDYFDSDMAFEAAREGIPYLQFDGDISLMCAGAGLTTTVYDLINYEGGSVANYLEFGGPNYKKGVRAMELCLENHPKVILIVTFGTIARADVMADGIAEAMGKLKPSCPIVACIRGTGEDRAVETLRAVGLDPVFDTEEAVRRAVALAKAAGGAKA